MKKYAGAILVLLLLSSIIVSGFEGATEQEQAKDALKKLYKSSTGAEFKGILAEIEKDSSLKNAVIKEMSKDIMAHPAKGLIPKGSLNLVFTDAYGNWIDPYFKVNADKSIADFGTGTLPSADYTVYFDETLLKEARESKNQGATLANAVDNKRIRFIANTFPGKYQITVIRFLGRVSMIFIPIVQPQLINQGNYQKVCTFSNIQGGKKVTCSAYKVADTFCAMSMLAPGTNKIGKGVYCDDNTIRCVMPCGITNVKCATGGTLSTASCQAAAQDAMPAQQEPAAQAAEECPIFCAYGPVTNYGSSGQTATYPDCEVKDFNTCTGQAYTGIKYEGCSCIKAKPSVSPCPETCALPDRGAGARCWVDPRIKGKAGEVCAGHVYGVGNWLPYQKAPDQPACICA